MKTNSEMMIDFDCIKKSFSYAIKTKLMIW